MPRAKSQEPRAKLFASLWRSIRGLITNDFSSQRFWYLRRKASSSNIITSRIYSLLYSRYMSKFCASIPLSASIDSTTTFPHGIYGIFISGRAKIGANCTIFHQVTIGSNTLDGSKHKGSPAIGDNVFIGCGAKIIGGVHVGSNVCVGANCIVVQDVPDNSTVVMPAFRVIPRKPDAYPRFIGLTEFLQQEENNHDE